MPAVIAEQVLAARVIDRFGRVSLATRSLASTRFAGVTLVVLGAVVIPAPTLARGSQGAIQHGGLATPPPPAPWLGPLRPRPVPHGPKVIPVKSDASSFLALIRGLSSPLSKAPRCAHKRCLRPSEPLRGRCSPFEPSDPRHGTERLIRGVPGAGRAADLADLAQQLCLGIYRRLAMIGAEGDLP
ncbi:DMT family transporter [Paracoccus yeei]|uniref:DMT family transporter n=1 Tax=Paracoccus yeei TaxID=147645 RepID=UPI003BF8A708